MTYRPAALTCTACSDTGDWDGPRRLTTHEPAAVAWYHTCGNTIIVRWPARKTAA